MKIPFGKPLLNSKERKIVSKILKNNILTHGPYTEKFEKNFAKFTGAPHAITTSSCTAGMHLAYHCIGLKKNDEVIVSSQTHVATAHAIEFTGAKPIFIDSELKTGNLNIDLIEKKINKKTKAIAIVHFLGIPVDKKRIMKIAKKYKLFVLEDCALSVGAKISGIHTGLIGDVGVFSFYPVKQMTTAEGGMVITKNKYLAKKIRSAKAFGYDKSFRFRKTPGIYNVKLLGFNYRMSEIHAGIGIHQLKKVTNFLKARERNYMYLYNFLKNIKRIKLFDVFKHNVKNSYYCFPVIFKISKFKRNVLIKKLNKLGIGTSIYYPHPVPRLDYYKKKYNLSKKDYKNSSTISDQSIMFPIGPHVRFRDLKYIKKHLLNNMKEMNLC